MNIFDRLVFSNENDSVYENMEREFEDYEMLQLVQTISRERPSELKEVLENLDYFLCS